MSSLSTKQIWADIAVIMTLALLAFPVFVYSAESAATKAKETCITYECGDDKTAGNCDFKDLVKGTTKVVNFGTILALQFSVVVIAVAGFNLMISGDNPNKRKEARDMLWKVVQGIVIIIAAWLVVTLILNGLGVNSIVQFG